MNKNFKYILIIAGVLILGAVFFVFYGGQAKPDVALEASADKAVYEAGEEINLSLSLKNTGEVATCISDIAGGSIVFNSITRDGEEVETRSVPANYIEAFPKLLEVSLKPVEPGESLQVELHGEEDPGLGARALSTTALEDGGGTVIFYNVGEAGRYALELAYRYTGPVPAACENVFEGPSNSVNIEFTVNE